jgi:photosystem II stability/assembly factor-like uncharacterized protein
MNLVIKHIIGLAFPICLFFNLTAFAQWTYIGLGDKKVNKLRLYAQNLYATTNNGIYRKSIYSSDTSWISIGLQGHDAFALSVLNSDTIYAGIKISGMSNDTIAIYRTTDGGINWEDYQNGFGRGTGYSNHVLSLESYPHQDKILFATGLAQIAKSNNLGENWQLVWNDWDLIGVGVHFLTFDSILTNILWSGGESGFLQPFILKSNDLGENWQENWINVGGDNACYSCVVDPFNSDVVYIGMEGRIIKTTDGGNNWATIYSPLDYPYFYGIAINRYFSNIIYASGLINAPDPQNLVLHKSQDNGSSWSTIIEGSAGEKGVLDLLLVSGNNIDTLFLATFGAGVYRYEETLTNVKTADNSQIYKSILIKQNYPNPFNPSTTISFDLPTECIVSVNIYDITGRQIKTLASSRYPAGSHRIQWDGRDNSGNAVASGIYIYRIQAGNYLQSKKMILLK